MLVLQFYFTSIDGTKEGQGGAIFFISTQLTATQLTAQTSSLRVVSSNQIICKFNLANSVRNKYQQLECNLQIRLIAIKSCFNIDSVMKVVFEICAVFLSLWRRENGSSAKPYRCERKFSDKGSVTSVPQFQPQCNESMLDTVVATLYIYRVSRQTSVSDKYMVDESHCLPFFFGLKCLTDLTNELRLKHFNNFSYYFELL